MLEAQDQPHGQQRRNEQLTETTAHILAIGFVVERAAGFAAEEVDDLYVAEDDEEQVYQREHYHTLHEAEVAGGHRRRGIGREGRGSGVDRARRRSSAGCGHIEEAGANPRGGGDNHEAQRKLGCVIEEVEVECLVYDPGEDRVGGVKEEGEDEQDGDGYQHAAQERRDVAVAVFLLPHIAHRVGNGGGGPRKERRG